MDQNQVGTTTPGQSEYGSNVNEGVFQTPHISKIASLQSDAV